jgi:hypothetical protein
MDMAIGNTLCLTKKLSRDAFWIIFISVNANKNSDVAIKLSRWIRLYQNCFMRLKCTRKETSFNIQLSFIKVYRTYTFFYWGWNITTCLCISGERVLMICVLGLPAVLHSENSSHDCFIGARKHRIYPWRLYFNIKVH